MIRVQIRVLPEGSSTGEAGEDWGEWDLVSLPRAGDHIDLSRNDDDELLVVRSVTHSAVQHPVPRSETPYRQRKAPSICIIAARSQ